MLKVSADKTYSWFDKKSRIGYPGNNEVHHNNKQTLPFDVAKFRCDEIYKHFKSFESDFHKITNLERTWSSEIRNKISPAANTKQFTIEKDKNKRDSQNLNGTPVNNSNKIEIRKTLDEKRYLNKRDIPVSQLFEEKNNNEIQALREDVRSLQEISSVITYAVDDLQKASIVAKLAKADLPTNENGIQDHITEQGTDSARPNHTVCKCGATQTKNNVQSDESDIQHIDFNDQNINLGVQNVIYDNKCWVDPNVESDESRTLKMNLSMEHAKTLDGDEYYYQISLKELNKKLHEEQSEKQILQLNIDEMELHINALKSQVKLQHSGILRLKRSTKVKYDTMQLEVEEEKSKSKQLLEKIQKQQNKIEKDSNLIENLHQRLKTTQEKRKIDKRKIEELQEIIDTTELQKQNEINIRKLRQENIEEELLSTQMELANSKSILRNQLEEMNQLKEGLHEDQYRNKQNKVDIQYNHDTDENEKLMIKIKNEKNSTDVVSKQLLETQEYAADVEKKFCNELSTQNESNLINKPKDASIDELQKEINALKQCQSSELQLIIEQKDKDIYNLGKELNTYKSLTVANKSKISSLYESLKETEADMKILQQKLQFTESDQLRLQKGSAEYLIDLRKAYDEKLEKVNETKDAATQNLTQALVMSQDDLVKAKEELKSSMVSKVKQIDELHMELADARQDIKTLKENLQLRMKQTLEMKLQWVEANSVIERLTLKKENLTDNPVIKQKFAELVGELEKTKDDLLATRSSLEIKLKKEQEMELKLNKSSMIINDNIPALTNQLVESQEDLIKVKTIMERMKYELDNKEAEVHDLQFRLSQSTTVIENLTLEKEHFTENPILRQKLAELDAELEKSNNQLLATQSSLEIELQREQELELQLNNSNVIIDRIPFLTSKLKETQDELTRVKTKMNTMKQQLDAKAELARDMEEKLKQSNSLIAEITNLNKNPILKQNVEELTKTKEDIFQSNPSKSEETNPIDIIECTMNGKKKRSGPSFAKQYLTESSAGDMLLVHCQDIPSSGTTERIHGNQSNEAPHSIYSINNVPMKDQLTIQSSSLYHEDENAENINKNDVIETDDVLNLSWNSDDTFSIDDELFSDSDNPLLPDDQGDNDAENMVLQMLSSFRNTVPRENELPSTPEEDNIDKTISKS